MSFKQEQPLRKRQVPMRVLNLGLSRTGTTSMKIALEQLGLQNVYHLGYDEDDCGFWLAAMEAKYEGKGRPFGKKQWDHVFSNCDAVSDLPVVMFAEELIAAYPDAKVILTIRDIDSWHDSMLKTICNPVYKSLYHRLTTWFDPQEARLCAMSDKCEELTWHNDFVTYGKTYFQDHNDLVRKLVPQDHLLEFEAKSGWEPLCIFLEKDVPDTPYPNTYNVKAFVEDGDAHTLAKWKEVLSKIALRALPIVLASGAILWATKRIRI